MEILLCRGAPGAGVEVLEGVDEGKDQAGRHDGYVDGGEAGDKLFNEMVLVEDERQEKPHHDRGHDVARRQEYRAVEHDVVPLGIGVVRQPFHQRQKHLAAQRLGKDGYEHSHDGHEGVTDNMDRAAVQAGHGDEAFYHVAYGVEHQRAVGGGRGEGRK